MAEKELAGTEAAVLPPGSFGPRKEMHPPADAPNGEAGAGERIRKEVEDGSLSVPVGGWRLGERELCKEIDHLVPALLELAKQLGSGPVGGFFQVPEPPRYRMKFAGKGNEKVFRISA